MDKQTQTIREGMSQSSKRGLGRVAPEPPPRYDAVFFEGQRELLAERAQQLEKLLPEALATHLIDVTTTDFARAAREATGGRGVDVVFDHLGGATFERSLKCIAWGGRLVLCGATSAPTATLPLRAVFFKSLSILGSTMGSNAELARLLPWFETGALAPVVARTFPLEEAPAAQELLAARGVFGKIVLTVGGGGAEVPRPKGD